MKKLILLSLSIFMLLSFSIYAKDPNNMQIWNVRPFGKVVYDYNVSSTVQYGTKDSFGENTAQGFLFLGVKGLWSNMSTNAADNPFGMNAWYDASVNFHAITDKEFKTDEYKTGFGFDANGLVGGRLLIFPAGGIADIEFADDGELNNRTEKLFAVGPPIEFRASDHSVFCVTPVMAFYYLEENRNGVLTERESEQDNFGVDFRFDIDGNIIGQATYVTNREPEEGDLEEYIKAKLDLNAGLPFGINTLTAEYRLRDFKIIDSSVPDKEESVRFGLGIRY